MAQNMTDLVARDLLDGKGILYSKPQLPDTFGGHRDSPLAAVKIESGELSIRGGFLCLMASHAV